MTDSLKTRASILTRRTTIIALSNEKKGTLVKIQSNKPAAKSEAHEERVNISNSHSNAPNDKKENPLKKLKEDVSAYKTMINFQQSEINDLKRENEKLDKKLKEYTSDSLKDTCKVFGEKSTTSLVVIGSNIKKLNKSYPEESFLKFETTRNEEKSGNGWTILILFIRFKNLKREEAVKLNQGDIRIKGDG